MTSHIEYVHGVISNIPGRFADIFSRYYWCTDSPRSFPRLSCLARLMEFYADSVLELCHTTTAPNLRSQHRTFEELVLSAVFLSCHFNKAFLQDVVERPLQARTFPCDSRAIVARNYFHMYSILKLKATTIENLALPETWPSSSSQINGPGSALVANSTYSLP